MRGEETPKISAEAFTRLELIVCVLTCTLLMGVLIPAVANSGARSERVACLNNLRQIGTAYANIGLELPDGAPPWRLTMSQRGNQDHPAKNNVYIQFLILSNFLATPKALGDPADERRGFNPAQHWGVTPGGLLHPGHRNNAVSYFLGVHGTFRMPREALAGDRNVLSSDQARVVRRAYNP